MSDKITRTAAATTVREWWPNQLDLTVLHRDSPAADPMGADFDYAAEFATLDLEAVRRDLLALMTDSQEWWPADYGHYGPLFIRMAWHSAGTYRISDGRGGAGAGAQRLAPLNSWPDNANLDKARRLLWPIKRKYGRKISWADLMILAGNCALESMGFATFGFGGGREDAWEPEDIDWGSEHTWLGDERYSGERELADPLAAVQMGLIYVNPEGPNGVPDPLAAALDIRETFRRMAMNDEETVALIAGGHTFGKTHGAADAANVGPEPEAAPLQEMGLGWRNAYGTGKGDDTITSGLEGAWTPTPVSWDTSFFDTLFGYEWELSASPAGAKQWVPTDPAAQSAVPDPHDPSKRHAPVMLTTDLALRMDPVYEPIARRFHEHPAGVRRGLRQGVVQADAPRHGTAQPLPRSAGAVRAAALAGPRARGLPPAGEPAGRRDPQGEDPGLRPVGVAARLHRLGLGLDVPRHRQARRRQRRPHPPGAAERVGRQRARAAGAGPGRAGGDPAGVRSAGHRRHADLARRPDRAGRLRRRREGRKDAGFDVEVPFTPGRTDATQEQTDIESFAVLEPAADGFRNYLGEAAQKPAEHLLVDKASLLTLSAPEMTVLVGGLRVLGANYDGSDLGVLTARKGTLTNDFFVNLLDMGTIWQPVSEAEETFEGRDRVDGRDPLDGKPRRPGLRLELPAARHRRGLRERRRAGEVRARLRRRLGQGHDARSVRPHARSGDCLGSTKPECRFRLPPVQRNPQSNRRDADVSVVSGRQSSATRPWDAANSSLWAAHIPR